MKVNCPNKVVESVRVKYCLYGKLNIDKSWITEVVTL